LSQLRIEKLTAGVSLMLSERRRRLLVEIALLIADLPSKSFVRVGIDGVDGAGKTVFADELALVLYSFNRPTIRASVDGFHNQRDLRYRLGKESPDGFYLDSYNYDALRAELLDPLGPTGSGRYRTQVFDHVTEMPTSSITEQASPGSVLLLDGIFLHRPELLGIWDLSIFLHVPFEVSIPRGANRGPGFGSPDPNAASNRRYVEGQRRYLRECNPQRQASVSIDNSDLQSPLILHNK
jgi:uridine kinase